MDVDMVLWRPTLSLGYMVRLDNTSATGRRISVLARRMSRSPLTDGELRPSPRNIMRRSASLPYVHGRLNAINLPVGSSMRGADQTPAR